MLELNVIEVVIFPDFFFGFSSETVSSLNYESYVFVPIPSPVPVELVAETGHPMVVEVGFGGKSNAAPVRS